MSLALPTHSIKVIKFIIAIWLIGIRCGGVAKYGQMKTAEGAVSQMKTSDDVHQMNTKEKSTEQVSAF